MKQIKEMMSPGTTEHANAWAAQRFAGAQQAVASGVVQAVIAVAGDELDRLTPQTRLIEDLALNELQRVQLMLAVEQEFGVEIADRDGEGIQTIAQLVGCVQKARQAEAVNVAEGK